MKNNKFVRFITDVFFPKRCAFCGDTIGFSGSCACAEDLHKLLLEDKPVFISEMLGHEFDIWGCFPYEEPVSGAVLRLKEYAGTDVSHQLAVYMWQKYLRCNMQGKYDFVIPVPMHKKAYAERGFNQTEELAKHLCAMTGAQLNTKALVKTKNTQHQRLLNREDRLKNLDGAFSVSDAELMKNKRVLLVDDVVTTGGTLKECAQTLFLAGAAECSALCFAATI